MNDVSATALAASFERLKQRAAMIALDPREVWAWEVRVGSQVNGRQFRIVADDALTVCHLGKSLAEACARMQALEDTFATMTARKETYRHAQ